MSLLFTSVLLSLAAYHCSFLVNGFTPTAFIQYAGVSTLRSDTSTTLSAIIDDDNDDMTFNTPGQDLYSAQSTTVQTLEFVLSEHKPLGCTAEESLANYKHVFLSQVTPGGNAEKAGLQIGDVIVGVSGSFGNLLSVNGSGLDRVRALVAGRSEEEPLTLQIVRGTDVMSQHETALIDLCTLENGTELDQCLAELYRTDYDISDTSIEYECDDEETECMLNAMFGTWNEEDTKSVVNGAAAIEEVVKKPKPAPWSSRSSPSGTFVRDPKTGKLVNIDEN